MLLLRLPLLRLTTHPKKGRSLDPPGRSAVHSWPMPSAYCSSMTAHLWPPPPTALIEEGKLKPQPRNAICETETAAYWRCRWLLNTPQCHAKGEQESTSRTFLKRIARHLESVHNNHTILSITESEIPGCIPLIGNTIIPETMNIIKYFS